MPSWKPCFEEVQMSLLGFSMVSGKPNHLGVAGNRQYAFVNSDGTGFTCMIRPEVSNNVLGKGEGLKIREI